MRTESQSSSGKRRRGKSKRSTGSETNRKAPGSFVRRFKSAFRIVPRVFRSAWFPSATLLIFLFVNSISFALLLDPLGGGNAISFTQLGADMVGGLGTSEAVDVVDYQAEFNKLLYLASLLMLLFQFRLIVDFLRKNVHLVLALLVIGAGAVHSLDSGRVIINLVQLTSGLLLALTYALTREADPNRYIKFCIICIVPLLLIHLGSFWLFFASELDVFKFWAGEARYGGFPGNPNTAGAQAVLGIWFALYLLLQKTSKKVIFFGLFSLLIFCFSLSTTGSGTSTIAAAVVVLTMIFLKFFTLFRAGGRVIYSLSSVLVGLVVFFFMMLIGFKELKSSLFENLGKDDSLTGRTEIWEVGIAAFKEKPLFGWSLDLNASVFDNLRFSLPSFVEHFHNGYIETLVSGGILLGLFVLYNFWRFIVYYWKSLSEDSIAYGMIGGLIILLIMNYSEYSILRPRSVIYQLYLMSFCLIATTVHSSSTQAAGSNERKVRRVRRKPAMRFN